MKNLNNYSINKKKVIFRADLNIPLINGKITDNSRIEAIKSSIKKLLKQQNKIFILSHFGRPKDNDKNKYSLQFILPTLQKEFGVNKVYFLDNLDEKSILRKIEEMSFGEICLIENIRFYPEEEKNDQDFVKKISKKFDLFVNDAFSVSHRDHASVVGFAKYLPAIAGDSLIEEIKNIDVFLNNPKKPNLAIIGGSKISSKIDLLNNLIELFDTIVVGGAMANTFLYANKVDIGISFVEKDLLKNVRAIQTKASKYKCKLILPVDAVCSKKLTDNINIRCCEINNVLQDHMILDVGEKTTKIIKDEILKSQMIIWNGPLGAFEYTPFDQSSVEIANTIKKYSKDFKITSLAGGGDTISLIKSARAEDGFTYISKAGGAFLEWLEGKESPGVRALKENTLA